MFTISLVQTAKTPFIQNRGGFFMNRDEIGTTKIYFAETRNDEVFRPFVLALPLGALCGPRFF